MINLRRNAEWGHHAESAVVVVLFTAVTLLLWLWCSDVVTLWLWQKGWY